MRKVTLPRRSLTSIGAVLGLIGLMAAVPCQRAAAQPDDPPMIGYAEDPNPDPEHGATDPDTLFEQNDDCTIFGVTSQYAPDIYASTEAADDFEVPYGEKWSVERVKVRGFYLLGPHDDPTLRVVIYEDDYGLPGAVVHEESGLVPTYGVDSGDFVIELEYPVRLCEGKYWLSVQPRLDVLDGQWFWTLRDRVTCNQGAFQNPDDILQTGCTTWDTLKNCFFLIFIPVDLCFSICGQRVETELAIDKYAERDRVQVNGTIRYFIEVRNTSDADAYDVEVTDVIPNQLQFLSANSLAGWTCDETAGTLICSTPVLRAYETAIIEYRVRAIQPTDCVINVATVTSDPPDRWYEDNSDEFKVRIVAPAPPDVPMLDGIGLVILATLMAGGLVVAARRSM